MKKYKVFISILIIYIIANMVLSPKIYIMATSQGLKAWAIQVLPSILPFIFFTKLLFSLGSFSCAPPFLSRPCKALWGCNTTSFYVFLCSIISGYPIGAAMTADLYQAGKITRTEACKMCSFCSTSGPMFIVGSVGISMIQNAKYGYIILISHILGALLNGILYRKIKITDTKFIPAQQTQPKDTKNFSSIIQESISSVLSVGAVIAIFFVVTTSFSPFYNLLPSPVVPFAEGIIEITKGCLSIAKHFHGFWSVVGSSFIISFGGISTILQSVTFLSKFKMPIKLFLLQKITHALLASVLSIILFFLI